MAEKTTIEWTATIWPDDLRVREMPEVRGVK